jgi:hypothetical protein
LGQALDGFGDFWRWRLGGIEAVGFDSYYDQLGWEAVEGSGQFDRFGHSEGVGGTAKLAGGQAGREGVPDGDGPRRCSALHSVHDEDVRLAAPGVEQLQRFPAEFAGLCPEFAEPAGDQEAGGVVRPIGISAAENQHASLPLDL